MLWFDRSSEWDKINQYVRKPINPFVPNAPFLYILKTSENRFFWCFQGVEKGCIGNEWVKLVISNKIVFISYLVAPWPILGPWRGGRLSNPMFTTRPFLAHPKDHREPRNEVGPQSPANIIDLNGPLIKGYNQNVLRPYYDHRCAANKKAGCDKTYTHRQNVRQKICCVPQVSGYRTNFCMPI